MHIPEPKDTDLQHLGLKYHTVKAHPAMGYLPFYEALFTGLRDKDLTLMELGAGPVKTIGASFFMWRDYFPKARIIGVDNKHEAAAVVDPENRIKIEIGDLGEEDFLAYLSGNYRPELIVDDASHQWAHQIRSFEVLFHSLAPGGIYVVEDMHTSYEPIRKSYGTGENDAAAYFLTLSLLLCGRKEAHPLFHHLKQTDTQVDLLREIEYISFFPRMVVIQKKQRPTHEAPRPAG